MQLGLYLGAVALAEMLGIATLFLITEPRLLAHFRRLGFPVRQIGVPVQYHGWRVLSMADVVDPVADLPFFMRPLYRVIAREIDEDRRAAARPRSVTRQSARLTGQVGPGHAGARPPFR